MAFSGIGKLIKDLVTGTPVDTDYFAFGNTDLKKISFANLRKALGIDALNSALTVKTRNIEGSYLTCNITEYGKITWFRISNYVGSTLKQGTDYSPFKFGNIPVHSVIQKIYLTGTSGFLLKISNEDGRVTITPFGADIDSGTGINVSEVYISK